LEFDAIWFTTASRALTRRCSTGGAAEPRMAGEAPKMRAGQTFA
jgi:hypothetical protein